MGGDAAVAGSDIAANAAKDTAENAAKDTAEDAGKNAAAQQPDRLAAAADPNVDLSGLDGVTWRDSNETLWRFTDRSPQKIMQDGGMTPWDPTNTNLNEYVADNRVQSAFVGTTRDPGYNLVRKYRYTLDAPGGIDVNASIADNVHWREHEIAFPGGIKLEHIKGWETWDPLAQQWKGYTANPYYRPPLGAGTGKHPYLNR
ncbi:hypothetical protein [Kitasatospora sp. GP30]|uniref:scabin-related ADP-ribosyltransferase n=1 Tax=Kitasatospora sp. GP30 TaxID=3035084 RepID=UPI000C70189F|nr:hypothetical protein [Kitasatospora sp. GP30]